MTRRTLLALVPFIFSNSSVYAASPQLSVVIPKFNSKGTAADAFKKLEQLSKESDPKGLGIRIIFKAQKQSRINLSLDNMPVSEILRYICLSTGYKYKITNRTVNITAP